MTAMVSLGRRLWPLIVFSTTCGCGAGGSLTLAPIQPPCSTATPAIAWIGPEESADREKRAAWCASVGPASIATGAEYSSVDVAAAGLVVVTWNIHEGHGDVERFVRDVRSAHAGAAMVLLLQEAARTSAAVPLAVPPGAHAPRRAGPPPSRQMGIDEVAARLQMALAYVPSMRNGRGGEDRGAAVLSTLPLDEVAAIELPWVRQRHVAVVATIVARTGADPWRLRVVSAHLDNRPGRGRQAAALARYAGMLPKPTIVGGDLNTWFGARERAARDLDAAMPRVECGNRPTFRFRRHLDYVFASIDPSLRRGCEVAADTYGSDHHPVMLSLFR
jgi:endonuclease/exonuclease/phosphatase family metal-dependent hydrolase